LGEIKSPYGFPSDPLSYRITWALCPKCKKIFKVAHRGKLPIWESIHCPNCSEMIIPIGIEKNPEVRNVCFNPSKRNDYDKIISH
jgi:DNA-directed RNA polymerase subunit RPC12/RpoP